MLSEVGGHKSRTGGLSTTLAGPDGRVFGGCVAGLLVASSPVQVVFANVSHFLSPFIDCNPRKSKCQVIVGSFIAEGQKDSKTPNYMEPLSKVGSSSPSRGTFSESSGGAGSPLNLSSGGCNNSHPQMMSAMPWK